MTTAASGFGKYFLLYPNVSKKLVVPSVMTSKITHYYWKDADNFGDGPLNRLLIPKIFPNFFASPAPELPSKLFLAIGSVMGHREELPLAWKDIPWIVFGSGFQYGTLDIPPKSEIYALRGPLTHELCHKHGSGRFIEHAPIAYSDPAILLPIFIARDCEPSSQRELTIMKWDWKGYCTNSILTTRTNGDCLGLLRKIWSSTRIITDSLHVAITADAYGISWFPLRWEFKWQDHFQQYGYQKKPIKFSLSDRGSLTKKQQDLMQARDRIIHEQQTRL